jgi:riboflavin biosynthesis pyrimidine reductase
MRRLLPTPLENVELVDAYAISDARDRTHVRLNMISSVDGAVTVKGTSGGLGGTVDKILFRVLRQLADVILVGAGTMRKENYHAVRFDDNVVKARTKGGQLPIPPIAVVTRSGDFDWNSNFFTDATAKPIIITTSEGANTAKAGDDLIDIVVAGEHEVDLRNAAAQLTERGLYHILCEGGPHLNGDLNNAGLINEICLTVSPKLVRGSGPRIIEAPELSEPIPVSADYLYEDDGFLFYRLKVR